MIRRDFKQTWELLRQNRTFSALYIAGTALPVALTMIVVMYYHIRISPVYPELHRDNLYELKRVTWYHHTGSMTSGTCSLPLIRDWFYPLQSAEAVTAIYYRNWSPSYIRLPDGVSEMAVRCKSTDPAFFKVFDFRFVDGVTHKNLIFDAGRFPAFLDLPASELCQFLPTIICSFRSPRDSSLFAGQHLISSRVGRGVAGGILLAGKGGVHGFAQRLVFGVEPHLLHGGLGHDPRLIKGTGLSACRLCFYLFQDLSSFVG